MSTSASKKTNTEDMTVLSGRELEDELREIESSGITGFDDTVKDSDMTENRGGGYSTLSKTYAEVYPDQPFPKQYSKFSNTSVIPASWVSTTCTIVNELKNIDWFNLGKGERKRFFKKISESAKNDPDEYKEEYSKVVYALVYYDVWRFVHSLINMGEAEREDIASSALTEIMYNSAQVSKYNSKYAPSTYFILLAQQAAKRFIYKTTGTDKTGNKAKRGFTTLSHYIGEQGLRSEKLSAIDLYESFELINAQPMPFDLLLDIKEGRSFTIIHDNLDSAMRKSSEAWQPEQCAEEKDDAEGLVGIFHAALEDKPQLLPLLGEALNMALDKTEKRVKKVDPAHYRELKKVLAILQSDSKISKLYHGENWQPQKRNGFSLGESKIPESVALDVGMGEIIDFVEH